MYASYSLRTEGEAVKESIVCGHHIHKEVWGPITGQELPVLPEPNNHHDRQVVAIYIDGCRPKIMIGASVRKPH